MKAYSYRQAAARFGVRRRGAAINWVNRLRETGSVAPGKMGGHKPRAISGEHRVWLLERIKDGDFTLRGLVVELAERGLKVDYRSVWEFVHAEKLSFKKKRWSPANAIAPTWRAGGRSGRSIKAASSLTAWSSSTRPGPRPTWRRCGAGRRAASVSSPKSRTAAGRR